MKNSRVFIFIGVVVTAVIAYFLLKKSGTSGENTTTGDSSTGNSILNFLSGKDTTKKDETTNTDTNTSGTGTNTDTGNGTTTITGASEPLGLRYNGGQVLYKKYDGKPLPSEGLGYLLDGTIIYINNVTYSLTSYEYVPKSNVDPSTPYNSSGVNTASYMGYFQVGGTWTAVYGQNKYVNLSNYPNAVGFLEDGAIVYAGIYNEGTPEETTYYYL